MNRKKERECQIGMDKATRGEVEKVLERERKRKTLNVAGLSQRKVRERKGELEDRLQQMGRELK